MFTVYMVRYQIIYKLFFKLPKLAIPIPFVTLLFFYLTLVSLPVFALIPLEKYQINGNITNAESGTTLPYATISVHSNNLIIKTLASDSNGNFEFTLDSTGKYTILVNSIGFQSWKHEMKIDGKSTKIELGIIKLIPGTEIIGEVAVIAQKLLVRTEIDKIVYDIEADPDSKTMNVLEILRKVPMVTVDGEDHILVKGSSNFKILLNGKATSMFTQNPQDILRSFPAAIIKNIELITNPSSKYEAEGIGGIINIITTKKQLNGLIGGVNTGINTSGEYNGGGFARSKIKKLGFSMNYNYNHYQQPKRETYINGENLVSTTYRFSESESDVLFKGDIQLASVEASYEIDSLNLISLSAGGYTGLFLNNSEQLTRDYNTDHSLSREFANISNSSNDRGTVSGNIDYQRTFIKPDKTFTISYKLDGIPQKMDFENEIKGLLNYDSYRQKSKNDASGTEHTFQLDYYNPITKMHQIECGIKYILRKNISNSEILRYDNEQDVWFSDKSPENKLDYDQQIIGLYCGYVLKLKTFSIKTGLRTEGTVNSGYFKSAKDTTFSNRIFNIIPYISLMKTIDKGQNIKISYTQRLSRPSILYLNPYVNNSDPLNISFGNPELDAEISHTFDISYGKISTKYNFNISLSSALTNNAIESISSVNASGSRTTTYKNIGKNQRFGGYIYGSFQPGNKFNINTNLGVNYLVFEANTGYKLKNEGFTYTGSLNVRYSVWKNGSITCNANIFSPKIMLQGKTSPYWRANLNFSQDLFNKKLTVAIYATEPLRQSIRYEISINDPQFRQQNVSYAHFRSLSFNLSYRFGQMNGEIKKAKRSIINEDVK